MVFLRFLLRFRLRLLRLMKMFKMLIFFSGLNFVLTFFLATKIAIIKIDAASATTPPSLEGIDRRLT